MSLEPKPPAEIPGPPQRYLWLAALIAGYIGIYLCRKNLSVAIPMLKESFHVSREEIGAISSYSTIAYAAGKFLFGGVVDRVGGRVGFLGSLIAVCVFGALGGLAPTIPILIAFYSLNRLAGAAGWPAMMKLTPLWFSSRKAPFAIALLSLSFVAGGACATFFAGMVASWSGANWRAVMAAPSAVLLVIILLCWAVLPRDELASAAMASDGKKKRFNLDDMLPLLRAPQFWIVCAMSFSLTLMRETFNTWMPDFIKTEGGAEVSTRMAAFLSTPLDILGVLGTLFVGWIFGRLSKWGQKGFLSFMLAALAAFLYYLPSFFKMGLGPLTFAIGAIGFLTYGPYILLAGALSLEIGGQKRVGTVSGIVDGVGYLAGILAGAQFGRYVDAHGYTMGFHALAGLALMAAISSLFLTKHSEPAANPAT